MGSSFGFCDAALLMKTAPQIYPLSQTQAIEVVQVQLNIAVQRGRIGRAGDGVGGVDRSQRGKLRLRGFRRGVVKGHGLDQRYGEAPDAH